MLQYREDVRQPRVPAAQVQIDGSRDTAQEADERTYSALEGSLQADGRRNMLGQRSYRKKEVRVRKGKCRAW